MSYKISAGIDESELPRLIAAALKKYGLYEGKAVNYRQANIAPVVMCTLSCNDKILIAKRAQGLADAEGYWSTINGFIDEIKPVKEFARQEIREELGIEITDDEVKVGRSYTVNNSEEKRSYIVFPCLISLKSQPAIKLDWEHTDFAWINRQELESYKILEDLPHTIDAALALKNT
ncbi:MAG TPA: NUDIX domain-containing protein [Candidatus Saccharimonadales bacterium]|nr:NUDIX domain-containing protein [Candidatus Saccharimonadales bacterium]